MQEKKTQRTAEKKEMTHGKQLGEKKSLESLHTSQKRRIKEVKEHSHYETENDVDVDIEKNDHEFHDVKKPSKSDSPATETGVKEKVQQNEQ